MGLAMLEIRNLNEFYEDNNKNYNTQLKALGVFDKKTIHIDKHQKEVIGMSSIFSIFFYVGILFLAFGL